VSPRGFIIRFAADVADDRVQGITRELKLLGGLIPWAPREHGVIVNRKPELERLTKLLARWEAAGALTWTNMP